MQHTHSRTHNGSGVAPRLRARSREKGGLLRGLFRQAQRHPFAAGALMAAVGWLLSGSTEQHNPTRARRAAGHAKASGAGRAMNGEARHG